MKRNRIATRREFLGMAAMSAAGSAILVACAKSTSTTPTQAPPASTSGGASAPTAAAGGGSSQAAAPTPTAAKATSGQKITISISQIGAGSQKSSDASYRLKELRAAFPNVTIDNRWMSYSNYVTKIGLITSTGDLADLQFANAWNDVPLMMDNQLLKEMGPLLDQYGKNILAATPKESWDSTLYSGKQYAVAHNIYDLNSWGIYYRKDWLDELGLKVPETLDEYEEVLKAFTFKHPAGSRTTYGRDFFNSIKFDDDLFHAFGVGVGHHANGFWQKRNGKLELDWVQPAMRDAWTWLRKIWGEKVIDPSSITAQITYWGQPWSAGKVGTQITSWTSIDSTQLTMQKTDPKAEIIAGPAEKGPQGHQGFSGEDSPWVYVTPVKSQHPDVAVQIINWFFIPQNAAKFICEGEPGYDLKGFTKQGWCEEYSLAEKRAMGKKWDDMEEKAQDISAYNGFWMPISASAVRPWLLDTMPDDMKTYFQGVLKARFSPAALDGMKYAQKYVMQTAKSRPTKSDTVYWPRLQQRFLELMTQSVAGSLAVDTGWKEWLDFFQKNGGPTLTQEANEL